ncbi:MAG: hypothetical protein QF599_03340, partial [Planctomycetota bacterium]|nr:hypothetical protein [Planctomycetota bacterium]
DLALVVVSAAALAAPGVVALVSEPVEGAVVNERRPVAPSPQLAMSLTAAAKFPDQFEQHWSDTIGLRTDLLRLRARLLWYGLGVSPTPLLVRGRADWVFLTASQSLEVHRGLAPLSDIELEEWCFKLEERRDALAARGVSYLFAIAPNKNQVYGDFLPPSLTAVGSTRLDQLIAHLKEHSDFQLLDLRPALRAERDRDEGTRYTYYPLGTHWTNRGAFAAHVELVAAMRDLLAPEYESMTPFLAAHCRRAPQDKQADTWADRMYLEDVLFQEVYSHNPDPQHTRASEVESTMIDARDLVMATGDAALPEVVMFHDSFGMQMRPFMAEVTEQVTCFRDRPLVASLEAVQDADLVLDLRVERCLVTQEADQACAWDQAGLRRIFQGSNRVARSMSAAEAKAFAANGRLRLSVEPEPAAALLAPIQAGPRELVLEGLEGDVAHTFVVAMDLEAAQGGRLYLAWRTRRVPNFSRGNTEMKALEAGRSTVYFHLHAPDLEGALRLRFPHELGNYTLYRLEVRAVDR